MDTHLIEDPAIETQLEKVTDALLKRLCVAGMPEGFMDRPKWRGWGAVSLARMLAGRNQDQMGPSAAAKIVMDGLMDPRDATDPTFWGSPLGRAVAYWGTGEPSTTTRACAASALGCTRQNVLLMLRDGRLSEPVDAGTDDLVSTASLAHAMRSKYPLGAQ